MRRATNIPGVSYELDKDGKPLVFGLKGSGNAVARLKGFFEDRKLLRKDDRLVSIFGNKAPDYTGLREPEKVTRKLRPIPGLMTVGSRRPTFLQRLVRLFRNK